MNLDYNNISIDHACDICKNIGNVNKTFQLKKWFDKRLDICEECYDHLASHTIGWLVSHNKDENQVCCNICHTLTKKVLYFRNFWKGLKFGICERCYDKLGVY